MDSAPFWQTFLLWIFKSLSYFNSSLHPWLCSGDSLTGASIFLTAIFFFCFRGLPCLFCSWPSSSLRPSPLILVGTPSAASCLLSLLQEAAHQLGSGSLYPLEEENPWERHCYSPMLLCVYRCHKPRHVGEEGEGSVKSPTAFANRPSWP